MERDMTNAIISKGDRTRQAIEEAAYELFLEYGFSATSMRQIAERAGIALGGIYNHFTGKDEIFQTLIISRHPYLKILPILIDAPGDTAEAFVRNSACAVQEELGSHPEFIKLMYIEVVEFNGKHFPKLYDTLYPQVLPLLQRFTVPGSGVRDIQLPHLLRAFIGSIMTYYLTESLMSSDKLPPALREMSLEEFMDVFLHGILEKGG
jgi:AcrR family transcriptional regulator